MAVTGPWAAVEAEDESITVAYRVKGKGASMWGLLYFINLKFCTYNFLNKYQNLFTGCLFSGRIKDDL